MRLHRLLSLVLIIVSAMMLLSSRGSADTGDWLSWGPLSNKTVESSGRNTLDHLKDAAKWINDTCKPDQMSDVASFFSQAGKSGDWNIYVFCKQGSGKVKVEAGSWENIPQSKFTTDGMINNELASRTESMIGIYSAF